MSDNGDKDSSVQTAVEEKPIVEKLTEEPSPLSPLSPLPKTLPERPITMLSPVSPIFLPPQSEDGDYTIIRSSDNHNFHVNTAILHIASPVFAGMELSDSGVLTVSEPACILDVLFSHAYPIEPPTWTSMDGLSAVLDAAFKYDMRGTVESLRRVLISPRRIDDMILPPFVDIDPVRVFAIARPAGLDPEADMAARATVHVSLKRLNMSTEVENMATKHYRELIDLREEKDRRGDWKQSMSRVWNLKGTPKVTPPRRSNSISSSRFGSRFS